MEDWQTTILDEQISQIITNDSVHVGSDHRDGDFGLGGQPCVKFRVQSAWNIVELRN
ncbi:hypothetical protein D3C80_2041870 [compost metagenome]